MPGERPPVETDPHGRDVGLRLHRQIDEAGRPLHRRRRLLAERSERSQVRTEDSDGDAGARPRQHVVDPVGDRLADGDGGTGNERQALADVGQDGLARPAGVRQPVREPHVYLGRLDALHVLVQLRPPRPPRRSGHFRHVEQGPLDGGPERVRLLHSPW